MDHLVLLVGGNPLPNAVAGSLLVGAGGMVSLVHSPATARLAHRLRQFLEERGAWSGKGLSLSSQQGIRVMMKEIDPAEPCSIIRGVHEALDAGRRDSVGLNYTGGTKAMAVHAHQAVREWVRKRGVRAVLSYLDARSLQMFFDPLDPASGAASSRFPVGYFNGIGFADLMKLHGWKSEGNISSTTPVLVRSACALAEVLADPADGCPALKALDEWRKDELEKRCRREDKAGKWKSKTALQSMHLPLPTAQALEPFVMTLKEELGVSSADVLLGDVSSRCGLREPGDLCEWLHGKWLESLTIQALLDIQARWELHDLGMNIEPRAENGTEVGFEIDVVAMRGYQLFALSCSTAQNKGSLKLKLFEAAHRARQLGGDEACVGLVCCTEQPQAVEQEMSSLFGSEGEGRIRVFGRRDLADLSGRLSEWIRSQGGGEG